MSSFKVLILSVLFLIVLAYCTESSQAQTPITSEKEDLTAYFSPSKVDNLKKNSLFVFVGEKIEIKNLPQKELAFNSAYIAKYKILDKIYGDYSKDTIEFEVYDHYGVPAFAKSV